jgi:hypothetical protein
VQAEGVSLPRVWLVSKREHVPPRKFEFGCDLPRRRQSAVVGVARLAGANRLGSVIKRALRDGLRRGLVGE